MKLMRYLLELLLPHHIVSFLRKLIVAIREILRNVKVPGSFRDSWR